jgi:hypothetical protein
VDEAFGWVRFLPQLDRRLFVDELTAMLVAAATVENFAPVAQLLREWVATAELFADPKLARRLRRGLKAEGDRVPAPAS